MRIPRRLVLVAVAIARAAVAAPQQPVDPAAVDLEAVRSAFSREHGERAAAVLLVGDREPVLLTAGRDAGGEELGPASLVPLGSAVRLLIADAVTAAAREPAELDAVAASWAGTDVSVRELLRGSRRVPDWYAFGPVDVVPDVPELLRCAEVATRLDRWFTPNRAGVGELELLRQHVFDDRTGNWAEFLRTRLAPIGAGVDPVDLAMLDAAAAQRLAVAAAAVADLRVGTPDCLRLGLSLRDLQRWWRWRLQRQVVPLTGSRHGYTAPVHGHGERELWKWQVETCIAWTFVQYPGAGAAMAVFGAKDLADSVQREFESCLFGPVVETLRFGGGSRGRTPSPTLEGIHGRWEPVDGDAVPGQLRLEAYDTLLDELLLLHWRGQKVRSSSFANCGADGYDVQLAADGDHRVRRLLLWAHGEDPDRRLRAVFVEEAERSAVPRCVEFRCVP